MWRKLYVPWPMRVDPTKGIFRKVKFMKNKWFISFKYEGESHEMAGLCCR